MWGVKMQEGCTDEWPFPKHLSTEADEALGYLATDIMLRGPSIIREACVAAFRQTQAAHTLETMANNAYKGLKEIAQAALAMQGRGFSFELHIDPNTEFTRKFGKRVKAGGGTYSDVRGNRSSRYVTLRAHQWELADEIAGAFPPGCVIIRWPGYQARFVEGIQNRAQVYSRPRTRYGKKPRPVDPGLKQKLDKPSRALREALETINDPTRVKKEAA